MNNKSISRRALLASAAAVSTMMLAPAAEAGSMPQAAVKYQAEPKAGHQCSGCKFFQPGATADAVGACKLVAGQISPKGWCSLWAVKAA